MMKASILIICLLFVLQINTCSDGYFTTIGNPDAAKGKCTACLPFCITCVDTTSCQTGIDALSGLDRTVSPHTPICSFAGASYMGGYYGYNKATDSCDRCKDGCQLCVVDYDKCVTCKGGWEFDMSKYQCLSSTVLALTVLVLIFNIILCACACKL